MTNQAITQPQQSRPEVKQKRRYNYTKKTGRPRENFIQRLSKINFDVKKLKVLYQSGWTDEQVADFLGVTRKAINDWKKFPEFKLRLKTWKDLADSKVEKCLYKRAVGYKYDEVTYEKSNVGGSGVVLSGGEIEAIKHTDTAKTKIVTKAVPPDVTAQIFWLKNRQPEQWRDKHEHDHKGAETHLHLTTINVKDSTNEELIRTLLGRMNDGIPAKP